MTRRRKYAASIKGPALSISPWSPPRLHQPPRQVLCLWSETISPTSLGLKVITNGYARFLTMYVINIENPTVARS